MKSFAFFVLLFISLGLLSGFSLAEEERAKKSISLHEAIEIGLVNNPAIKSGKARIAASRGRLWSGISLSAPEFFLSDEFIPNGQSLSHFSEKAAGINQSVEFPVHYYFRGQKLVIERKIYESEFASAKLSVIAQIKSAYFKMQAIQEQCTLARQNLALAEDFLKTAEIKYSAGEATHLERLTAKVQFTEAQNDLDIETNHLAAASVELANAMGFGRDHHVPFQPADSLVFVPYQLSFKNLLDSAISINPVLAAEKLRMQAFSIDKNVAWFNLLPSINLSYFRQTRDGNNGFYGVSVGASLPLWCMFDHRGKIQEASANVAGAQAEYSAAQNKLYARLKRSFADFQNEEKRAILYRSDLLPQALEIYRTALKSYEAGEVTYIEFVQAKQTLADTKRRYLHTLLDYHLSIVSLEEVVGIQLN
jgi:cobalt-zinc-cadmium resistance protein CzcA